MVNIVIAGIPKSAKLPKFMNFLKRVVFRCKKELHVNYIKLLSDTLKQISISTKYKEAVKAQKFLDGFCYIYSKVRYPLECWLENLDEDKIDFVLGEHIPVDWKHPDAREDRPVEREEYEPPRKSRRYSNSPVRLRSLSRSRSRSRSPFHSSELKAIELKIELIRKQRILMEEETKLLLEKRKLEYLQNLGSKDSGKLAIFEEVCRHNDASEISDFLTSMEPAQAAKQQKPSKLPSFIGPCKEISSQMKAIVRKHAEITTDNAPIFWNLLRSSVKKRLAIIVEGKAYMPTKAIVGLYRVKYPHSTDRSFVDEVLNTVKKSFWPGKAKKPVPAAVVKENKSTEAERPPADIPEVDLTAANDAETHASDGFVDLDEFVDMENDFENWAEDDFNETANFEGNAGNCSDNREANAPADDGTESNVEEGKEGAATTESAFEEVSEAVLIVDDADRFREIEPDSFDGSIILPDAFKVKSSSESKLNEGAGGGKQEQ